MAAEAMGDNPRKMQFSICNCSWKRKGIRLENKKETNLYLGRSKATYSPARETKKREKRKILTS